MKVAVELLQLAETCRKIDQIMVQLAQLQSHAVRGKCYCIHV